jgi:cyanophycin synthetase
MGFQRFSLPVLLDDKAAAVLAEQQLDAGSVPAAEQICFLRRNSNVSEGGTAEDMTDRIHPDNLSMAERAARVVGLDLCGVDFLTTDIGRSWRENVGAICEVNDNPGFGLHHMGRPPKADIGAAYLSLLFADSRAASIPIVAIVESADAQVGRQLKAMLQVGGLRAGLATERELFVGEPHCRPIRGFGDGPGQMLQDPEIGGAIFSLSAGFIAEQGLPFEQCDVSLAPAQDAAAAGAAEPSELKGLVLLHDHTRHRALAGPPAADQREARQSAEAVLLALRKSWPALPVPAGALA